MTICYNKLWKLLIDKNMKKKDLRLATGMSTTQVVALADEAEFPRDREGVKVLRTEGHDGKRWVLLAYGSVIVHVFTQEAHDYYDLEHLWADATVVPASEWMPDDAETSKE